MRAILAKSTSVVGVIPLIWVRTCAPNRWDKFTTHIPCKSHMGLSVRGRDNWISRGCYVIFLLIVQEKVSANIFDLNQIRDWLSWNIHYLVLHCLSNEYYLNRVINWLLRGWTWALTWPSWGVWPVKEGLPGLDGSGCLLESVCKIFTSLLGFAHQTFGWVADCGFL